MNTKHLSREGIELLSTTEVSRVVGSFVEIRILALVHLKGG
ncbi:hypothetical protein QA601_13880 [Chitinispirillales bacterium ANBcel5]|nr:hypothetical protein [Chitinispirillales bacterium ANBcel5]